MQLQTVQSDQDQDSDQAIKDRIRSILGEYADVKSERDYKHQKERPRSYKLKKVEKNLATI